MSRLGIRFRIICLAALSAAAGCVEINQTPERVYSTSLSHAIFYPEFIRLDWRPLPSGSLSFSYGEAAEMPRSPSGDTLLVITLHTDPDYHSSADFHATSTLRYLIVSADAAADTALPWVSDLVLLRRSGDGGWEERDRRPLPWSDPTYDQRNFSFDIPGMELGPLPALSWSVERRIRGSGYFLPSSPGLIVRDAAAFSAKLYETSDP